MKQVVTSKSWNKLEPLPVAVLKRAGHLPSHVAGVLSGLSGSKTKFWKVVFLQSGTVLFLLFVSNSNGHQPTCDGLQPKLKLIVSTNFPVSLTCLLYVFVYYSGGQGRDALGYRKRKRIGIIAICFVSIRTLESFVDELNPQIGMAPESFASGNEDGGLTDLVRCRSSL